MNSDFEKIDTSADEPKFSVIIPNYNNSETLGRAIESVLSQSYAAYEIIVIDDGSTDDSKQVLKNFDSEIKVCFRANGGVSEARNYGVQIATGEWIAFLDADDEYFPDRLKLHAEWIKDDVNIRFLLADQESRTPTGFVLDTAMSKSTLGIALLKRDNNSGRILLQPDDFHDLIADGFTEIRTISLLRADFLKIGGFPLNHEIGEDLHFFIRLFATNPKCGVVPKILAAYYIYPESAIRKNPLQSMKFFVNALESLRNEIPLASLSVKQGLEIKCRHSRMSLAYSFLRCGMRISAVGTVLPSFLRAPSLSTLKDIFAIARGFRKTFKPRG